MRALVVGFAIAIATLAAAPAALASCIEPPPLEVAFDQAPAVFVGTVDAVDFQGRLAHVSVDGVWKGEVASEVQVQGTDMLDPNMMTSVDRTYQVGTIYVFFVSPGGVGFTDNACTNTTVADAELMATLDGLNGSPAVTPAGGGSTEPTPDADGRLGWVAGGIVGVLVLAGIAWVVRQRRDPIPEIEGFSRAAQPTEQRNPQS